MKKLTLAGIMLACMSSVVFGQDSEKRSIVKVNMLSPLVRTFSGFYERKVSDAAAVQLGFSYTGATLDDVTLRGWSIIPEFRYYASQKGAMQGIYVAPFMRIGSFNVDDKVSKGELNTLGGGLLLGNQWVFSRGITLDVFLGPSYNGGKLKITSGENDPDIPASFEGFGLRSGVTLGIAF